MKTIRVIVLIGIGLAALAAPMPAQPKEPAPAAARGPHLWVTAYYPLWEQSAGRLTPQEIDFTALSHLVHFSVVPRSDGTVDDSINGGLTPERSQAVLVPAHAAGRKVLVCVGGENTAAAFRPAIGDAARPTFVRNLVQFVVSRGYDGVDIDMEPVEDSDAADYAKFVHALRAALTAANPKLLLTAATASEPALFGRLRDDFDQINLMTYDLSGPWPGWQTWYNAPLFDGGKKLRSSGAPFPSTQGMVRQFVRAGVPKAKLGIGVAFFGYLWNGASGPEQGIEGVQAGEIPYHALMDTYYQPARYHWDDRAQAPYLSVDAPEAKDRKFISYDDERLCAQKVVYARQQGLGGVIIWQLGEGYRDKQPTGQQDVLLQAVKHAWLAPARTGASRR